MSDPLIRVESLRKHFGSVVAVDGISFEVHRGEMFGILGPNGAGKTTTLEVMETLQKPTAGTVTIDGTDVLRDPWAVKSRIGVQLQSSGFYPELSLVQLLEMFAAIYNVRIDPMAVLRRFQLEEKASTYYNRLSGGQKQRFSLATTLIHRPHVIFLDEPTTGLDPQARLNLWDLLREVKNEGVTLVITTHYMEEAEQLCDRLVIMDGGHIVAEGSPRELVARYSTREVVELRFLDGDARDKVLPRLAAVGHRVEALPDRVLVYTDDADALSELVAVDGVTPDSMYARRGTLEDVFLILTGRTLED